MYGVFVIGVVFASTALTVGASQYAFGLFIEPLELQFGWSRTEISASLSFAAVSGLASPFIGRAMDRHGVRPVLVASLTVGGISFALRPFMSELWHWYVLSFLQFVAFSGCTVLPAGKLVASWYPHVRGRVMGIAATGNNFGGLVIPSAIVWVLASASWREGYSALAIISFALAGLAFFVVRERSPDAVADSLRAQAAHQSTGEVRTVVEPTLHQAVRTRAFYSVFTVLMLGTFTYSIVLPHVFAHLSHRGMTQANASFTLGTLAIGGIFGKLFFGILSERAGARRAVIVNLFGQALFAALLAFSVSLTALVVLTPMFGFFMGGFGSLIALLFQDTFGLKHFGSIMGLASMGMVISWGLGPLIAGVSYDLGGGYGAAFLFASTVFLIAAAVLLFSSLPNVMRPPGTPGSRG